MLESCIYREWDTRENKIIVIRLVFTNIFQLQSMKGYVSTDACYSSHLVSFSTNFTQLLSIFSGITRDWGHLSDNCLLLCAPCGQPRLGRNNATAADLLGKAFGKTVLHNSSSDSFPCITYCSDTVIWQRRMDTWLALYSLVTLADILDCGDVSLNGQHKCTSTTYKVQH